METPSLTFAPGWQVHLGADLPAADRLPDLGDLGSVAERSLEELGDRPFIRDTGGGWLSGREFLDRARSFASALAASGVRPGDRVVLTGQNSADFAAAVVGVFLCGSVLVAANPAYSDRELAHVVRDSRPAAILCDEELLGRAELLAASLSPPEPILGPGSALPLPEGPVRVLSLAKAALLAGNRRSGSSAPGPSWPAMIAYTSGTTGAPKGALLTHGNLL
nr:AMP-binding protein [Actinomycetota bacterium]